MVAKIFVSYRRADAPGYTEAIYNELQRYFPKRNIFLDIDTLQVGDTFPDVIGTAIEKSNILLAIIGANWQPDRLQNAQDWVRREIAQGLAQKHTIVIPLLVQGAILPRKEDLPEDLHALIDIEVLEIPGNVKDRVEPLAKIIRKKTSWFTLMPKLSTRWSVSITLIALIALGIIGTIPGIFHFDFLIPPTASTATASPVPVTATETPAPATPTETAPPTATETATALPTLTATQPDPDEPTAEPEALRTLAAHIGAVNDLSFATTSAGLLLASGGEDSIIRIWDMSQPQAEPQLLIEHRGGITNLIFSPDGSLLVSADTAGKVLLWDTETFTPEVFIETDYTHKHFTFSPDGNYLSVSSEKTFTIYNIRNAKDIFYQETDAEIDFESAGYTPNGVFVFYPFNNILYLLNTITLDKLWVGDDLNYIRALAVADNQKLATATLSEKSVTLWHGNTPTQLNGHRTSVLAIAFSSDTVLLASASSDGEIILWNTDTATKLGTLTDEAVSHVGTLHFSPDGQTLIAAGDDGVLRLWYLPRWIPTYFEE